jgi:hypothetical protein
MDLSLGPEGWDAQARAWVEATSEACGGVLLAWAIVVSAVLLLLTLLSVPAARRRFWCAGVRRTVEVVFEEFGLPGHRLPVAVVSCTAFDPPTDVRCQRACLSCAGRAPLGGTPPTEDALRARRREAAGLR